MKVSKIISLPFSIHRDPKTSKKIYRTPNQSHFSPPPYKWLKAPSLTHIVNPPASPYLSYAFIPSQFHLVIDFDDLSIYDSLPKHIYSYFLETFHSIDPQILSKSLYHPSHIYFKQTSYFKKHFTQPNREHIASVKIDILKGNSLIFLPYPNNHTKTLHPSYLSNYPLLNYNKIPTQFITSLMLPIPNEVVDYLLELKGITPTSSFSSTSSTFPTSSLIPPNPFISADVEGYYSYLLSNIDYSNPDFSSIKQILKDITPNRFKSFLRKHIYSPNAIPEGEGIAYLQALISKLGQDKTLDPLLIAKFIVIITLKLWQNPLPIDRLKTWLHYLPKQHYSDGSAVIKYMDTLTNKEEYMEDYREKINNYITQLQNVITAKESQDKSQDHPQDHSHSQNPNHFQDQAQSPDQSLDGLKLQYTEEELSDLIVRPYSSPMKDIVILFKTNSNKFYTVHLFIHDNNYYLTIPALRRVLVKANSITSVFNYFKLSELEIFKRSTLNPDIFIRVPKKIKIEIFKKLFTSNIPAVINLFKDISSPNGFQISEEGINIYNIQPPQGKFRDYLLAKYGVDSDNTHLEIVKAVKSKFKLFRSDVEALEYDKEILQRLKEKLPNFYLLLTSLTVDNAQFYGRTSPDYTRLLTNILYFFYYKALTYAYSPIVFQLSGNYGTGKDTIIDYYLKTIFSDIGIISNQDSKSSFNSHYITKAIVKIEEASRVKNMINFVKKLSGSQFLIYNEKGKPQLSVRNILTLFITTNEPYVAIEHKDDRRLVLLSSFTGSNIINNPDYSIEGVMEECGMYSDSIPPIIEFLNSIELPRRVELIYSNAVNWGRSFRDTAFRDEQTLSTGADEAVLLKNHIMELHKYLLNGVNVNELDTFKEVLDNIAQYYYLDPHKGVVILPIYKPHLKHTLRLEEIINNPSIIAIREAGLRNYVKDKKLNVFNKKFQALEFTINEYDFYKNRVLEAFKERLLKLE